MHYYNFNIGDYTSHTRHLSKMEDLAYRRLLDWYYLHEKPIPSDPKQAARAISMNERSTDVERVLNEFFTLVENGWINRRADAEIAGYKKKKKQAKEAGKASGKARQKANPERTFSGRSTDVEPTKNQETINKNQEPRKSKSKTPPSGGFVLPDWIPCTAWGDYVEMRKRIHKPLTERAKELAVGKLADLQSRGHPPGVVLDQSTFYSWQGLFEIKDEYRRQVVGRQEQPRQMSKMEEGRRNLEELNERFASMAREDSDEGVGGAVIAFPARHPGG